MAEIEEHLKRWRAAGVLDGNTAERIRDWEKRHEDELALLPDSGLAWQGVVAVTLGAILLATGVMLFVSAHWDDISPAARFALVLAMVSAFHLAGGFLRERYLALSTALHVIGTVSTGAAIAVVGQVFHIEEHWPAAILLWALAALAGWMLLRDQAHQILALLLVPAWMFCELAYSTDQHTGHPIGQPIYLGRFLVVWAIFYLTMLLGSKRRAVHGVLFAAAAVAALAGTALMVSGGSSSSALTLLPFGTRFWAWAVIAGVPLAIAAFKGHWGLIPPACATVFAVLLPWCGHFSRVGYDHGNGAKGIYGRNDPNLAAYLLAAAFAVFIIAWGLVQVSRLLVNLGTVYFAIAVAWFYWSNILDKVGRSLGLIGLGVLFLAGGCGLELTRRGLMARMEQRHTAHVGAR